MSTVVFGDFEWDAEKARHNVQRHGVGFEEAASVFSDLDYVLTPGYSSLARLLVVVHCERTDRIRIISARKATAGEAKSYERSE